MSSLRDFLVLVRRKAKRFVLAADDLAAFPAARLLVAPEATAATGDAVTTDFFADSAPPRGQKNQAAATASRHNKIKNTLFINVLAATDRPAPGRQFQSGGNTL